MGTVNQVVSTLHILQVLNQKNRMQAHGAQTRKQSILPHNLQQREELLYCLPQLCEHGTFQPSTSFLCEKHLQHEYLLRGKMQDRNIYL